MRTYMRTITYIVVTDIIPGFFLFFFPERVCVCTRGSAERLAFAYKPTD